jgi:hypothetical protein
MSMIPTKKFKLKHLGIEGTSCTRKSNESSPKRHKNHSSHKKGIDATMKASIHLEVRFSTKRGRKSKSK